ncbi:UNVERIFIED_CONTAM: OsmC family protein [Kocuria sp. CPCC 205316]|uniref:OsmC family protein n=1 Tax=Kocuria TaxID=57493 RepID=UPI0036D7A795
MNIALSESIERFTADPAAGQISPKVTATLTQGRTRLGAGPFSWETDLPQPVGGSNESPSPTAYLLGALAGCAVAFIHDTLAPQLGVEITELSATASCTTNLGGLLDVHGTTPDLQQLRIEITVSSTSPAEQVEAMQQAWLARCPVYLALRNPNDVEVTFTSA